MAIAMVLAAAGAVAGEEFVDSSQLERLGAIHRDAANLRRPRAQVGIGFPGRDPASFLMKTDRGWWLTPEAVELLKGHFGRKGNWQPLRDALDAVGVDPASRAVVIGEQHGIDGNQAIVSAALETLKDHGYSLLFVEVMRGGQEALDGFMSGKAGFEELAQRCANVYGHPGKRVLETARRLGYKVVAMDKDRPHPGSGVPREVRLAGRDRAMFEAVWGVLKTKPEAKAVVYAGALHAARWAPHQLEESLAELLRRELGDALNTFVIFYGRRHAVREALEEAAGGLELPVESVIWAAGPEIARVPLRWGSVGEQLVVWPYGDWDYVVTLPAVEVDVPAAGAGR